MEVMSLEKVERTKMRWKDALGSAEITQEVRALCATVEALYEALKTACAAVEAKNKLLVAHRLGSHSHADRAITRLEKLAEPFAKVGTLIAQLERKESHDAG